MPRKRNRGLSERERQCLEARRDHLSAKEIGKALNISPHTVAMHWGAAKRKLDPQDLRPDYEVRPIQQSGERSGQADEPGVIYSWAALLILAFGVFSILLTALGWALLYLSPYFSHLWR